MKLSDVSISVTNKLEVIIAEQTYSTYEKFIPDLINVYLDTYNDVLLSLDIDQDSLAKPELFYDSYKIALKDFKYLSNLSRYEIKISVPAEDSFDFSGKLLFLKLLVEGITGMYYEIPRKDLEYLLIDSDLSESIKNILGNLVIIASPDEASDTDFCLLPANYNIHNILNKVLRRELVVFPFSNFSPVDLFTDGINYFNSQKEFLTKLIISKSLISFKRSM